MLYRGAAHIYPWKCRGLSCRSISFSTREENIVRETFECIYSNVSPTSKVPGEGIALEDSEGNVSWCQNQHNFPTSGNETEWQMYVFEYDYDGEVRILHNDVFEVDS
jgi:hypothetical protein